jgi:CubicO group peptidase (beta-lactamase class C family)
MKSWSSYKKLLISTIVVSFSFVVSSDEVLQRAPEATDAEASLMHWETFEDIPKLENAFFDVSPQDRKDGIQVGLLGKGAGDKAKIQALAQEIAEGKHGQYDSLLIAQNGKLLFESYYNRGRINLPHPQSSATKSYTSLALGRAIQLGYLTMSDLEKPIVHFLKDLDPSKFADGVDKITLHQALTMTTGIRITEENWKVIREDPSLVQGQQEIQEIFERTAPITHASKTFKYGTGPGIVMHVIEAVVPGTAKDFIKRELLDKLGIHRYGWETAISGIPESGWGVSLTSRDMAKVGLIAINKGRWNGEQLISKDYIEKSTERLLFNGDDDIFGGGEDVLNQGYGYFWWVTDLQYKDKVYTSASAQGGGGIFISMVKELDLVVIVTAAHREHGTQQLIAQRIIPVFSD